MRRKRFRHPEYTVVDITLWLIWGAILIWDSGDERNANYWRERLN